MENKKSADRTGQIITTSADVTLNGGLTRELPQNPPNSGLGIILICPDRKTSFHNFRQGLLMFLFGGRFQRSPSSPPGLWQNQVNGITVVVACCNVVPYRTKSYNLGVYPPPTNNEIIICSLATFAQKQL